VLKDLRAEGLIALYAAAILEQDTSSTVSLQAVDAGPFPLAVGAIAGAGLGWLGGPVGATIGAAGGTMLGALHKIRQEQDRDGFLQQAFGQVPPGRSAVVADIAEFGEAPLEAHMAAMGGLVLRQTTPESDYLVVV
jgi:uncharacterized membrane protein